MFFIAEKQKKNYSKVFFRVINRNWIIETIEHQKILNLLNEKSDSKFVTRKWDIAKDQRNANVDAGNEIVYNTEVLKPNLYGFSDAYILARGDIVIVNIMELK